MLLTLAKNKLKMAELGVKTATNKFAVEDEKHELEGRAREVEDLKRELKAKRSD